mgnify:CR=1 FL=1
MAEKNMNNFIPKNAVKLCNRCQNRNRGEVDCKMFPKRIPHEVLVGDIICKKYLPIEEK